jgi:hypothetical protein
MKAGEKSFNHSFIRAFCDYTNSPRTFAGSVAHDVLASGDDILEHNTDTILMITFMGVWK